MNKKKGLSKKVIEIFKNYLSSRDLKDLKNLCDTNVEMLKFNLTPYKLCDRKTIRDILLLYKELEKIVVPESFFYNTILHNEIANSHGDEVHRDKISQINAKYHGKEKSIFILNHLKQLKDKNTNISLINEIIESQDIEGKTPLLLALMTRNYEIADMLLDVLGANPNIQAQDDYAYTPLHIAYIFGKKDIVKKLIKKHSNEGIKDKNGNNPIHYEDIKIEERKELIDQIFNSVNLFYGVHYKEQEIGKLPEYLDAHGKIIYAIKSSNIKLLKENIDTIDLTKQDHLERTPLHIAIMRPSLLKKENFSHNTQERIEILKLVLSYLNNESIESVLEIKNKSKNTVKSLIERDIKSNNKTDAQYAEKCSKAIKEKRDRDKNSPISMSNITASTLCKNIQGELHTSFIT